MTRGRGLDQWVSGMPHGIRETVGWVLGFGVLLLVLYVVVDGWTRRRLSRLYSDLLGARWSDRLSSLGNALGDVVRAQGIEGGLLATFLVITVLLVWLMMRS